MRNDADQWVRVADRIVYQPEHRSRHLSALGQSRQFCDVCVESALPPKPDIRLMGRHGRNVPSIPDTPTATPSGEGPRPSQRSLPTHDTIAKNVYAHSGGLSVSQ